MGWHEGVDSTPDGRCDKKTGYCVGFDHRSHAWYIAKGMFALLMSGVDFIPSRATAENDTDVMHNALSATVDADSEHVGQVRHDGLLQDNDVLSLTGGLEFRAVMTQLASFMSLDDKRQRMSLRVAINRLKYLYASCKQCLLLITS